MNWWGCCGVATQSGPVHDGMWARGDGGCTTLSARPREGREAVGLGEPTGNMRAMLGVTDGQRSPTAGEVWARGRCLPSG